MALVLTLGLLPTAALAGHDKDDCKKGRSGTIVVEVECDCDDDACPRNEEDDEPIEGAQVKLERKDGKEWVLVTVDKDKNPITNPATTDKEGEAYFSNMPCGLYKATANKEGYAHDIDDDDNDSIEVNYVCFCDGDDEDDDFDLELTHGASQPEVTSVAPEKPEVTLTLKKDWAEGTTPAEVSITLEGTDGTGDTVTTTSANAYADTWEISQLTPGMEYTITEAPSDKYEIVDEDKQPIISIKLQDTELKSMPVDGVYIPDCRDLKKTGMEGSNLLVAARTGGNCAVIWTYYPLSDAERQTLLISLEDKDGIKKTISNCPPQIRRSILLTE